MAFDPTYRDINSIFAGYSADASNITLPIANVPELTATEADEDPTVGDSRKLIFALMERFFQWYQAIPSGDRPTRLTITRSDFSDPSTGQITKTYAVQVVTVPTGIEVVAE